MSVVHYHRHLFQWHCRNFFKFRRHLSPCEKDYLESCFALADGYSEVSETGYSHFSYYSYSHRVAGTAVNSSRLAYGSVTRPAQAWEAAVPVLEERGVVVPEFFLRSDVSRFYGLGWDILERQFKVYFRVVKMAALPSELLGLAGSLEGQREEGLVSYTYTDGALSESKVYLYPLDRVGEARMVTSERGTVLQHDLGGANVTLDLNEEGVRILKTYRELGEPLDTIAWSDRDHFTVYFP